MPALRGGGEIMQGRHFLFTIIAALVLIADQATKVYIDSTMRLHDTITVIPNFFNITYIRNRGAAFGILAQSSWRLPFFILVSLVALIVIIIAYRKLRNDQRIAIVSMSLIFSGALGNLIDRIRLGEVIDFIYVHWYEHYWPAFNIADSAICVGVALLAVDMLLEEKRQKNAS